MLKKTNNNFADAMGDLVKDAGKSIDQEVALRRASIATGTDYLDIPADKIYNETMDDFIFSVFCLITAEVFVIGLKLKEEQDLTI